MSLSKLFGPNWRTSFFGTITLVSAFLTQFPSLLSAVFEPEIARKIAAVAALISGYITFANTKDRQVSGNGTPENPVSTAKDGRSVPVPLLIVTFGIIAIGLGLIA